MRVCPDIVIVEWSAGKHVRECLDSVVCSRKEDFPLQRVVVVVDNASCHGSSSDLDDPDLPLPVIRNPGDCGLAAINNKTLGSWCIGDYYRAWSHQ